MDRIMIVEDDPEMKKELSVLLSSNGYEPVYTMPCELVLLDIHMPGESGYGVCRRIRKESAVPIIFLTALDSPEDELLGFAMGADDYVRKPYHSSVLLARIARLLKRKDGDKSKRGLTLLLDEMKVSYEGNSVELSRNETRILACLMKKDLCTKQEIVEDMWLGSLYIDENTLYVNISRLREKLASIGATDFLQTVRGVGYRL